MAHGIIESPQVPCTIGDYWSWYSLELALGLGLGLDKSHNWAFEYLLFIINCDLDLFHLFCTNAAPYLRGDEQISPAANFDSCIQKIFEHLYAFNLLHNDLFQFTRRFIC